MTPDIGDHRPDAKPVLPAVMPPHLVLHDFLDQATVDGLLAHAVARESVFEPTKTGRPGEGKVDPRTRISAGTQDLGRFKPILKAKVRERIPDLVVKLGATPIASPTLELQLVAHNDGAFYTRHIDTRTASDRQSPRVLSAVYYFHAQPKAFSGGALRLYAIGGSGQDYVDIEPAHNSLLVFHSWVPHEVMPISCPSKRFIDSRFAINCWVHRGRTDATS